MIVETTCSGGGPIIALPAEIAPVWRGTLPPDGVNVPKDWQWGNGDIICDYDRACDEVKDRFTYGYDEFGWLPVGKAKALVFTAEQQITFVAEETGGIIANSGDDLNELIKSIPTHAWKRYPVTLELNDGRLFIFDSAYEGVEDPNNIQAADGVVVAKLSPGTYQIFHHNTENEAGLVRLEKLR